jgi:hypothetical protein
MIETLISSKTRIKLLLNFFLNSSNEGYLRMLEDEFQDSTNSIRIELNRLEQAKMLESDLQGNKKVYRANTKHPLFFDLKSLVLKHVGLDRIIDQIIGNLGQLEKVYLTGSFSQGLNSDLIELIFIGDVNEAYLQQLVAKSETLIHRKIAYHVLQNDDNILQNTNKRKNTYMLLWSSV